MLMITALECIQFPDTYTEIVLHHNDISYLKISLLLQHMQKSKGRKLFRKLKVSCCLDAYLTHFTIISYAGYHHPQEPVNIPDFKIDPQGILKRLTPKKSVQTDSSPALNGRFKTPSVRSVLRSGDTPISGARKEHHGTPLTNSQCPPALIEVKRKLLAASYTVSSLDCS